MMRGRFWMGRFGSTPLHCYAMEEIERVEGAPSRESDRDRGAGDKEGLRERRRMRGGLSAYWQRRLWAGAASHAAHVTRLDGSGHPGHATSASIV